MIYPCDIKAKREALGLSITDVANKVGFCTDVVYRVERSGNGGKILKTAILKALEMDGEASDIAVIKPRAKERNKHVAARKKNVKDKDLQFAAHEAEARKYGLSSAMYDALMMSGGLDTYIKAYLRDKEVDAKSNVIASNIGAGNVGVLKERRDAKIGV